MADQVKSSDRELIERLEYKIGDAYQIIGHLLYVAGLFDTPEGQRVLDYFAAELEVCDDFLPWPRDKQYGVPQDGLVEPVAEFMVREL